MLKVDVYWNLHKKCWSVRHKGKVVTHAKTVTLKDVSWVVSEAGRQRVLKEKRKNVHAFARGTMVDYSKTAMIKFKLPKGVHEVTYNPYKYQTFQRIVRNNNTYYLTPITHCERAILSADLSSNKPICLAQG